MNILNTRFAVPFMCIVGLALSFNLTAQNKPSDEAFFNLGKSEHEKGHLEDAVLAYSSAIDLNQSHASALYNRGAAHFSLAKYSKAKTDFDHVLKLNPEDLEAIERRGNTLFMMGDYAGAIEDYTILLNQKTTPQLLINRAIALKENGQYSRSNEDFDFALRADPTSVAAWSGKGEACFLQKRFKDAESAYAQAIKLQPNEYRTTYGLGLSQLKNEAYPQAKINIETAARLQPDATTFATLAYCYFKLGEVDQARETALKAHNLDVRCADAYNVMGLVALHVNNTKLAERMFQETTTWEPKHPEGLYNLGYSRYLLQDYKGAKENLDMAIQNEPDNGNAYYARASVRMMLSDKIGACSDFQMAQTIGYTPFPDDDITAFCTD